MVFISDVFAVLLFRCEMEKQILGKINGDFACRDRESLDSQVTLIQTVCVLVKPKATDKSSQHASGSDAAFMSLVL